ncbi:MULTISPECIES: hypothetical protein [unclassified Xanthomonas]|uniref:hypothetical protein n=1 Tax=unclassified Xanthomonas TaxID=2643310 RepID=UPI0028833E5F|nr:MULTISPECIES: hypothetical protein [unclassified Xanthomonas]
MQFSRHIDGNVDSQAVALIDVRGAEELVMLVFTGGNFAMVGALPALQSYYTADNTSCTGASDPGEALSR